MRFGLLVFASSALGLSVPTWPTTEADTFQKSQYSISKAGILANIGPNGSKDQGAYKGVVIASPSKEDPDYVYTWTRDSALVYKLLVDQYVSGRDNSLLQGIYDWIASQTRLQQVTNPSGTVSAGGLGEPKFHINETEFTGSWGRPQRDGPALRATTFITFANDQLGKNKKSYVQSIWPAIKLDLDYVAQFWNAQSGYDLWEEVYGSSFFTLAASHRSLRQGAALATKLGYAPLAKTYTTQAANVLCFLQSFWDPTGSYIISNINSADGRTGLDVNSILTSVHNFDPEAGCDVDTFQPCSDRALRNHKAVVDSFRSIYAINGNYSKSEGVAVGRYAEDVYYNGNPWYLATFAAAEQLYYATYQWIKIGKIEITSLSLPFFQQIYPTAKVGSYSVVSKDGLGILLAVRNYADQFVVVNKKFVGPKGGLAEQFDRATGLPTSAVDLTWSYASAITAFDARSFKLPESWGAKGLNPPTGTCQAQPIPKVAVTFNLVSDSTNAYVVGQLAELGVWDPAKAVQLQGTSPNWSVTVQLPIASTFEFKFIRKNADGSIWWESDPNLRYSTPANGTLVINETWRKQPRAVGAVSEHALDHDECHDDFQRELERERMERVSDAARLECGEEHSERERRPASARVEKEVGADPCRRDAGRARPGASPSVSFALHSRTSSRRNSPGDLRRPRRLPDDPHRRRSGFNTPTNNLTQPTTPAPSQPLIKRKSPTLSEPVTAPPLDSEPHNDPHPKQYGSYGVAVGVPLPERMARRQAARCSTSTLNDIEDDWTSDGRWNFGLLGSFDRRAPLPRVPQHSPIHPPRARGARGRGTMSRGYRGRGGGAYGYRNSPADSEYAVLPPVPPMGPYNPYEYHPWYMPAVPPMWLPIPLRNLPPPAHPCRCRLRSYLIRSMGSGFVFAPAGWIPISTIASFNRLRKLTTDFNLVRDTMHMSSLVEISPDGEKARMSHGGWAQFVLPGAQSGDAKSARPVRRVYQPYKLRVNWVWD
ncbi:1,4-alpha-D-glucan glucohydrolase [Rhizoctonia solani]|uniref:glucan 1,4-alpha-glucosidase n=1 Tax=Rhizoctonia solani TaxID=456999 RepID=A0A8H7M562_9AGAM|nr:1,4-alpha-D-glucan glucohydrolase [Rhizoctonia solani]